MNDAFIKLNLPSIPAPHYMGGEVLYHLGESTTPQTTLRPLPTSSFSKNQGEKVFTTQQYVKTYSRKFLAYWCPIGRPPRDRPAAPAGSVGKMSTRRDRIEDKEGHETVSESIPPWLYFAQ